jgi:formylglycine-generating enzyme required for sulfatase activity
VKLNPEETLSSTNKFRAYVQGFNVEGYAELFITVRLLDANAGERFGLSMQSYKDFGFEEGTIPFDTFPIESGVAEIFDAPMPLCFVGAGDFLMGTDQASDPYFDPLRDDYTERPQHLHPTGDYYISRYEITCLQWIEFMDAGGYSNQEYWDFGWDWVVNNGVTIPANWPDYTNGPDYPDYPIAGVCWYEAMAYAKYTGGRLPTEAEWEKACRGTDGRIWSWGNVYDGSLFTHGWPTPVGSNHASDSPYGASDMIGNVYEWTRDSFEWNVYNRYLNGNFDLPSDNEWHMTKGYPYNFGSGEEDPFLTRAAFHWPSWIEDRWIMGGFRLAFDPPE